MLHSPQMAVLYQSSFLHIMGWLAVPPGHPVHSICGVCRAEAGVWYAGAYFLLKAIDTALVLLS